MSKKKLTRRILLALSLGLFSLTPFASALPDQGHYDNSSAASIATAGNTMSITGKGANNIINWNTFSIAKGETVKFTDRSNYLNLVNGVDISRIYGTISGGGMVYLVNPYGILFGQGATLDNVGSFIASTRDISDINAEAFLNDPTNVNSVLYTDSKNSRNREYYPDSSTFVPTISVAEINLTNVPASATKIVLDGPGGVVLKNTGVLNKVTKVQTRRSGGELGIGSSNGNIVLTDAQKQKIGLIDGNSIVAYNDSADVLKQYKSASSLTELSQAYVEDYRAGKSSGYYMLSDDISASTADIEHYRRYVQIERGTFDGMGYTISNYKAPQGLWARYNGNIRNLGMLNVDIERTPIGGSYYPDSHAMDDGIGGVVGRFSGGNISNVYVTGKVSGYDSVGGLIGEANGNVEVRNSHNEADITLNGVSGAGGIIGRTSEPNAMYNVYNTGDITGTYNDRVYQSGNIGGIVGDVGDKSNILGAYNKGNIVGYHHISSISYGDSGENTYDLGTVSVLGADSNSISHPTWDNSKISSSDLEAKFNSDWSGNSINISSNPTTGSQSVGTPITSDVGGNSGGDSGSTGGNTGGDTPGTNPGGSTGGSTPSNGTSTPTGGLTDEDIQKRIEDAKAQVALQEYNDIIASIESDKKDVAITKPVDLKDNYWTYGPILIKELDDDKKKSIHNTNLKYLLNPKDDAEPIKTIEGIQVNNKEDNPILNVFKGMAKIFDKTKDQKGLSVVADWESTYEAFYNLYTNDKRDASWGRDLAEVAQNAINSSKTTIEFIGSLDEASRASLLKDSDFVKGLGIGQATMGAIASVVATTDGVDEGELNKVVESIADIGVEFAELVDSSKVGFWSPAEVVVAFGDAAIKGQQQYEKSMEKYANSASLLDKVTKPQFESSVTQLTTAIHELSWGTDELFLGKDYGKKMMSGTESVMDGIKNGMVKFWLNIFLTDLGKKN